MSNRVRNRRIFGLAAFAAAAACVAFLTGCVHRSGGTWMIRSAPTPEGWPELTPVGEVQLREYPAYRAATVSGEDLEGSGMRPMFMQLFEHIKTNDVAMTAPVGMEYTRDDSPSPRMSGMAFVYRSQSIGTIGTDGPVRVDDIQPRTFASVGVRGSYSTKNYLEGVALVEAHLAQNEDWRRIGEPRFLGYNSPFVPWFLRYGEVQIPVERAR